MRSARHIVGLVAVIAAVVVVSVSPRGGSAQSDDSGSDGVRSAGDGARFRVIDRFPERESDRESPDHDALELAISEQLAEAIRQKEWERASRLFDRRLGEEEPSHDFLHGYIDWKRQRWRSARDRFDDAGDRWSMLDDYAAFFAADAALKAGDAHGAVVRAAKVPTGSRLFGDALAVMAKGLTTSDKSTDRRRAIRVASRYLDHFPKGEHASTMRLTVGRLQLERGKYEEAADHLFSLLEYDPLSEEAEEGEKLLEKHREVLSEEDRRKIDERPMSLQLAHLRALYDGHDSEEVIEEASELIEEWTPGGEPRCQGLYWTARSHTKLRQHETALDWYERVLNECEGMPPHERKALYMGGKSFWNAGRKEKALEWFERLWTRFDDHSYADDGMYFAARIYRELDRMEEASELLADQVDRYPNGDMAADAHWLRVRRMLRREDYEQVVEYVDEHASAGDGEITTRGRLAYFRARALERSGRSEEAREGYLEVARDHPLTVYALFALNRIARVEGVGGGERFCDALPAICDELSSDGAAGQEVPTLPQRVRNDSAYRRGAALLRLGIREWARREFDALFTHYADNDEALLALADLLDRAGAHEIAYALPERLEGWRTGYPAAGHRSAWTIAYPRPFETAVGKWADERDVPRSLVWAIIRKESGYNPSIESWANAVGLMQLMEGTAEEVADKIGFGSVASADLLRAETNVELGTAYLADLAERFDGHLAMMAAGYNGGYGNVGGWLDERGDLPLDLWIEAIPYGQTRRYAKVVLANDWTYRWLYEERSVPRLTFDISGIGD